MKFYTSFFQNNSKLFVRGYDNGEQFFESINLTPSLYTKANKHETRPNTTMRGYPLNEHTFPNIWDAKKFAKANKDCYGYPHFEYAKINDMFTEDFVQQQIKVCIIDIETNVADDCDPDRIDKHTQFPSVEDPHHAVNLITYICDNEINIFCVNDDFNSNNVMDIIESRLESQKLKDFNFEYKWHTFESEKVMLSAFAISMEILAPDIISGWNSNSFDIPYLANRIEKLLGQSTVEKLSPFGIINKRVFKNRFGSDQTEVNIQGLETIDGLDLYKKFELAPRENYKLETIAQIETRVGKIEHDGTFKDFYQNDWETFVAYNIVDVLLVWLIFRNTGFIDVMCSMAHQAKCNYSDVFRVTRIWDNIINNYCVRYNIHVNTNINNKASTYEGAYVKPTIPGLYKWIASFDLKSLYPSLIVQQNISPETILDDSLFIPLNASDVVDKTDKWRLARDNAEQLNATLCSNGVMFDKSKQGIVPTLVEQFMAGRDGDKTIMFDWAKKVQRAKRRLEKLENENN